jgi:hypothetical protein
MALTTQQFQQWLEDPAAVRCMLVETSANISGTETQIYLSNRNYVTSPTSVPANTTYLSVLKTSVKFTETLSLDDAGSLSYGDISIDNSNGEYDSWLMGAWQGRAINIFIGDPKFARDDFTLIFSGIVADVSSSDRDTVNLQLRDFLETLNSPITETLVGNYFKGNLVPLTTYDNPNREQVRPLVFGEVFNITPVLIDPTELEFMVHSGPIERIIEIRDNGVPLLPTTGYTADLVRGTFKLVQSPAGAVTCSVQGDKNTVFNTTVAQIVKHIVKNYGTPVVSGTVTDANIDLTNFSNFDAANPQAVGVYITSKENVLSICQQLTASLGAQLVATRLGKLQLLKVTVPTSGGTAITDQDIIQDSLQVSQKPEIITTYKLGYCKNWTTQPGLLTGIPAAHKDLLSGEWLSATYTNEAATTLYKQNKLPEQKDTLLLTDITTAVTNISVTIAASSGSLWTITRSSGDWLTSSIEVNSVVSLTGASLNAANTGKNLLVVTMTTAVITVRSLNGSALFAQGPIASVTVYTADVSTEATRLVALRSVPRYIYRLTCTPKLVGVALGEMVAITHSRFGLQTGAPAQVVSTEIDWDTGFITLEILV